MQAVAETADMLRDHIGFGRMQIAARRIAAQRPAIRAELFPRAEPERQFQQQRDAVDGQWLRGSGAIAGLGEARGETVRGQRQRRARAAGEVAERIGLRIPIQRLRSRRIALQAMPGAGMVGERDVGRGRELCRAGR